MIFKPGPEVAPKMLRSKAEKQMEHSCKNRVFNINVCYVCTCNGDGETHRIFSYRRDARMRIVFVSATNLTSSSCIFKRENCFQCVSKM